MAENVENRTPRNRFDLGRAGFGVILVLLIIIGAGNLIASFRISQSVASNTTQIEESKVAACRLRLTQEFDAAISARSRASMDATDALENLIVAVFTAKGSSVAIERADLKAYNLWHTDVSKLNKITIPPLPKTACG